MDLLLYIAVIPAGVLLYYVYRMDRLEKEPEKLLWKLGGFGALCAVPAVILELAGEMLCRMLGLGNGLLYIFIENFFVVALVEEGCKYFTVKKLTGKSREFNCTYDGLLYSVYVSMGFAIIENVLYMATMGGAIIGIIRAVTAIPGHCFFGVFMGVYYSKAGAAEHNGDKRLARRLRLTGLGAAAAAHGCYDFFASVGGIFGVTAFLVLLAGMYILGIRAIKRASAEDRYLDPYESELHRSLERWICPACGTDNDGVVCGFCGWNIPKSGSTAKPVPPEKPSFRYAGKMPMPNRNIKLPLRRRLLPLLVLVVFLSFTFILVGISFGLNSPAAMGIVAVTAVICFFLALILPVVLITKNDKLRKKMDPEYERALKEYREEYARHEAEEKAYEDAKQAYVDYVSAVRTAEKKRAKLSRE